MMRCHFTISGSGDSVCDLEGYRDLVKERRVFDDVD